MRWTCLFLLAGSVFATAPAGEAEVHYAPVENLERSDVSLIRSARKTLDIAAYTLTARPVVDALVDARRRGVAVRIVIDPGQNHAVDLLRGIADDIRMKTPAPTCISRSTPSTASCCARAPQTSRHLG